MNNPYPNYQNPYQTPWQPQPPQPPIDVEELKVSAARRKLCRIGLALVVYMLVTSAVQLALFYLGERFFPAFYDGLYFNLITQLASYGVGIPVFFAILGSVPHQKPAKNKLGIKNWIAFLAISFLLMNVGSQIADTLMSLLENLQGSEISNSIAEQIEAYSPLANFLIVAVMAPIAEEFICRKLIIDRLLPYGEWIAVITSGVFFGLIHGNFYQFFYAALLGILFGIVYVKTGKLIHTILMHGIVNFFGSVVSIAYSDVYDQFLEGAENLSPWALIVALYSIALMALMVCGVFFAIHYLRKGKLSKEGTTDLSFRGALKAAWLNWGTFLLLGFCTLMFAASIFIL